MKGVLKIVVCILIVIIISCNRDRNTIIFENYLETNFNATIPTNVHYFIVVPSLGCGGCMNEIITRIGSENIIKEYDITFIISNRKFLPKVQGFNTEILFDTIGKIEKYDLSIGNVTIIKTNLKYVVDIININNNEDLNIVFNKNEIR